MWSETIKNGIPSIIIDVKWNEKGLMAIRNDIISTKEKSVFD